MNCCVEIVTLKKIEKAASPEIELFLKSRKIYEKGNQTKVNV